MKTQSPPWVLNAAPYVPGKPIDDLKRELGLTDIIKLASNENPHGPSPAAIEAMQAAVRDLATYPDPGTFALRHALADKLGVPAEQVLVGNGSNELITLLIRAFATSAENVVTSAYAFIAYKIVAGAAGVPIREVPTDDDFAMDVDGLIAACDDDTRLLFVANPNNPTGIHLTKPEVLRLLREVPPHVLVVLDEAYFEYADREALPDGLTLRGERENLVVMRTFSKAYGLAGSRVGYAVAPAYVAERIQRIREPFNVNHIGQIGALAALADTAHVSDGVAVNATQRERVRKSLEEMSIKSWSSHGNFVLLESPIGGAKLNDAMLRKGIILRPLRGYGLPNHIRVTIGTPAQTDRFLTTLHEVLEAAE